jgi:hypothetical protein
MSLVPVADVESWLRFSAPPTGSELTKLQAVIDSAESYIARRKGHGTILAVETITQRVPGGGTDLVLTTLPVVSVTSVTGADGGTLDVSTLDADTKHGLIRYTPVSPILFPMPWYTVVYQAGFATLDFDYTQAVKEVCRQFWGAQRGNQPAGNNPDQASAMVTANAIIDNLPSYGFA